MNSLDDLDGDVALSIAHQCHHALCGLIPQVGTDEGLAPGEFNREARNAVGTLARSLAEFGAGDLIGQIRVGKITTSRDAVVVLESWRKRLQRRYDQSRSKPTVSQQQPQRTVRNKDLEARDKWIYEQCCKGVAYDSISAALNKRKRWEKIESRQGIRIAAKRYAERHGLETIPRRQDL